MYYKLKSNILFRKYDSFGYLSDNKNFEYKKYNDNDIVIGDKIVSESGANFISVLDRDEPQALSELIVKISKIYPEIDIVTITSDVKDFFNILEKDGFLSSGSSYNECLENDCNSLYYYNQNQKVKYSHKKELVKINNTSQDFFYNHFAGMPQLSSVHIEITNKCNENCVHCYIPQNDKKTEMESDLFYNVFKQCREMKVLHLTISGGEPMLHNDFCNFIKICRKNNFSVSVLSNLTLLNKKIIEEMKKNPLLGVQTSLYSMDSSIHDSITTVKGSFEKTFKSIKELINNNIPLKISCPILKQNKNSYKDVIKWANSKNIIVEADYEILARYDNTTQNLKNRLSINEIEKIIQDTINEDSNYVDNINKLVDKNKYKTSNDPVCNICYSSICVASNGNVFPCTCWNKYVLGNLYTAKLEDIWLKSEKINYLRNLKLKDFPECLNCSSRNYCIMCMVRNANEDSCGNLLKVNRFFCKIAKLNKNICISSNE